MGITMSQPSNKTMVDELVEKHHYIMSPLVEGAFRAVDRALYFKLEEGDTFDPYSETPWRDGNLHLSAPCIYARAVEALELRPGHSFLNLGSGTGYLNTIVGLIIGPHGINHGIEYHADVVQYAYERLEKFKRESFATAKYDFAEPVFIHGDCVKLNPNSRYDRIYLGAACIPELETFIKKLIRPAGGVLVMPLDSFLLRYIRITETDWKVEKLMQVSFTQMIRDIGPDDGDNKMIDMPLAQPKNLKELCRIQIRQRLRDKTNQENPNLLNSDNIESRKIRKARAERKMLLKQEREFRRRCNNLCPYAKSTDGSNGTTGSTHGLCRRWPCREFNNFGSKSSATGDPLSEDRIMTRSIRRRFELSRLFNRFQSNSSSTNTVTDQIRRWDQIDSASGASSSGSNSHSARSSGNNINNNNNDATSLTRGEGCSRTRPFVSRVNRSQIRERAPSPVRLGEPYRVTRSAFPASRRADIRRIIDSSYRPVFMSSPSTASTRSDSSSSSSSGSSGYNEEDDDDYNRPMLPDFTTLLRIRRRALSSLASRGQLSIFDPDTNDLDQIDIDDSDYEEESEEEDSCDDDIDDPDLSGLESDENAVTSSSSSSSSGGGSSDGDDDDDGASSGASSNWQSFLEALSEEGNNCSTLAETSRTVTRDRTAKAAAAAAATTTTTTTTMTRHRRVKQELTNRKRKRHSSSSECSEASNTPSPSRRNRASQSQAKSAAPQQCCNPELSGQHGGAANCTRRRCCCPRETADDASTVPVKPTSSSSSSASAAAAASSSQLVAANLESDGQPSGSRSNGSASLIKTRRWTKLRSLISSPSSSSAPDAPRKSDEPTSSAAATTATSTTTTATSGLVCLLGSDDVFALDESADSNQRGEPGAAPRTTSKQEQRAQGDSQSRCHHHHHHHHRRRRRTCCKCSHQQREMAACQHGAAKATTSSGSHQSGSGKIDSSSSSQPPPPLPPSSVGCRNVRESGGGGSSIAENGNEAAAPATGNKKGRHQRRKKTTKRRIRGENECQRYHNHMSVYIAQLPVPRVLQSYLNFDRENS